MGDSCSSPRTASSRVSPRRATASAPIGDALRRSIARTYRIDISEKSGSGPRVGVAPVLWFADPGPVVHGQVDPCVPRPRPGAPVEPRPQAHTAHNQRHVDESACRFGTGDPRVDDPQSGRTGRTGASRPDLPRGTETAPKPASSAAEVVRVRGTRLLPARR